MIDSDEQKLYLIDTSKYVNIVIQLMQVENQHAGIERICDG